MSVTSSKINRFDAVFIVRFKNEWYKFDSPHLIINVALLPHYLVKVETPKM